MSIRLGYSGKYLYDNLVGTQDCPETVIKCIHGNYFSDKNDDIERTDSENVMLSIKEDLIIKPSNLDNGKGVNKIFYKNGKLYYKKITLCNLLKKISGKLYRSKGD